MLEDHKPKMTNELLRSIMIRKIQRLFGWPCVYTAVDLDTKTHLVRVIVRARVRKKFLCTYVEAHAPFSVEQSEACVWPCVHEMCARQE